MDILHKVRLNKRNNQLIVNLSRAKLGLLKQEKVKYLKIRKEDLIR